MASRRSTERVEGRGAVLLDRAAQEAGGAHRAPPMGVFTESRSTTTPPRGPGIAPSDEDQLAVRVDADDLEVGRRDPAAAHAPGHLRALEHAARRRARADRAGRAVVLVVAVAAALALEVVALHAAGEPLALRRRDRVDVLAGLEDRDGQLLAHLVGADVGEAQLDEPAPRGDAHLVEVTPLGHRERRRALRPVGHLERGVAVGVLGLHLDDAQRGDLDHGHRDGTVLVVPDLGHPHLLAHDGLRRHCSLSVWRGPRPHTDAPLG